MTITEADELFASSRYAEAFPAYCELLKKDPLNALLNYKIGLCYLKSRSLKTKALSFLEKAIEFTPALTHNADQKNTDAPLITYKLLGDAYCYNYKFDNAIIAYEKYKSVSLEKKLADPETINSINSKIETCKFGKELKELIALPVKIKTEKPPKPADTCFPKCTSSLSKDKSTLTFTFKVPVSKIEKLEDASYYEDLVVQADSAKPNGNDIKQAYSPMPDTIVYATTIGSSIDGQIILTYRNEQGNGNLYITRLHNNIWSPPLKINKSSNPCGWELNECISPDGNTMYFVSDRPGGYGGKDIYRCKKTEEGSWGKAVNMGPMINSKYDDEAPFIHPDGNTLFFSSNRHKPREYFENFTVSIAGGYVAGKPIVVGYPIDKSKNHSYYEVAADKNKIFTPPVIDKKKLKELMLDSLKQKESENFLITFINQDTVPLTLLKGCAGDASGTPGIPVEIIVTNNESGFVEGVYHADGKTGNYSFIIPTGNNNNITYKSRGYLFHSENRSLGSGKDFFEKNKPVTLQPLREKSRVTLNNIFFEENKTAPSKNSDTELNNIYELLKTNPGLNISLNNIIYSPGDKKYYKKLSRGRALAVKTLLVSKGIKAERIQVSGIRKSKFKKTKDPLPTLKFPHQQMELEITEHK